jgi:glutathione S-transferase
LLQCLNGASPQADPLIIWETLAIIKYLAKENPQLEIWPRNVALRAHASSLCSEMQSGCFALRRHCPMNIDKDLPQIGRLIWRDKLLVRKDIERIETALCNILKLSKGPFLVEEFSALHAFYTPVIKRIQTYKLPVSENTAPYMQRVRQNPSVKKWSKDAIESAVFRDFEEPYWFNSKDIPDPAEFLFKKAESPAFCATSRPKYAAAIKERIELYFEYFCPSPCP